jgi:hypothetical protein
MSMILPVPKRPDPGELRDYRQISVMPPLSKTLEVVMRDQMILYINGNRLHSPYQSVFHSSHSTATIDIQHDCDRRLVTLFVLFDISKACCEKNFHCTLSSGVLRWL